VSDAAARQPIKVGVLFDFEFPPAPDEWNFERDFFDSIQLVFDDAHDERVLDRPIEVVFRSGDGLPRGSVKAAIDATRELVDEGCLVIIGPMVSENAIPIREYLERDGRTPAISWCGSDDWLGEWCFGLSSGSLPDEPYVLANVVAHAGHRRVGVLVEESLIGEQYLGFFRRAAKVEGLTIVVEERIFTTEHDLSTTASRLAAAEPDALVSLGFGFGVVRLNDALARLGWSPPRYTGTAWQDAFISRSVREAYLGWVGLDLFDEENPLATRFLDRFEQRYARRPPYYTPGISRDFATVVVQALADAKPLSPRGVCEALERVKMLPAASGAPGTRISYGKWTRRGWMGPSYLVARRFDDADPMTTHLVGRLREPKVW
jgi:ABC-type branched-subunit amino acid transport system substrate-binding protein